MVTSTLDSAAERTSSVVFDHHHIDAGRRSALSPFDKTDTVESAAEAGLAVATTTGRGPLTSSSDNDDDERKLIIDSTAAHCSSDVDDAVVN